VTDKNGTPLSQFDYAPFGEELTQGMDGRVAPYSINAYPTATLDGTNQKFTSKERDAETGLDWFSTRYFAGAQGRFSSPDRFTIVTDAESREQFNSYLMQPQNWNKYAYTWNNPLRYTDPTGEVVELLGDADARKKELALLQSSVGSKAAGSLSINEVKDGDKTHYQVGIKGDMNDLVKMGGTAQELANLVANKSTVEFGLTSQNLGNLGGAATLEPSETDTHNTRVLINPNQISVAGDRLSPSTIYGIIHWAGQNQRPPWQVNPFTPEIALWHEFGHAWGLINGRPMKGTNSEALGWENQMRQQTYGPMGPLNAPRMCTKKAMRIKWVPAIFLAAGLVLKSLLIFLWTINKAPVLLGLVTTYDPGAFWIAQKTTEVIFDQRRIAPTPGESIAFEGLLVIWSGIECLLIGLAISWLAGRIRRERIEPMPAPSR
jgi:RHS repeat-associated protein